MVQFTHAVTYILAGFTLTSAAVLKRDAEALKSGIASITSNLDILHAAVVGFPDSGGSIAGALAIHNNAVTLDAAVTQGTTEATATGPLSQVDGDEILTSIEAIKPTILDLLIEIVGKKPAFDGLPLAGVSNIVLGDVKNLDTSTLAFADALISIAPEDLVEDSETIKADLAAAFDTAIAAYSE